MAACSAGLTALFIAYARIEKWDLGFTTNGFLAGLVAITCPCYWVSPTGAFFIGIVAGFVVVYGDGPARVPAHRRSDRRRAGAHVRAASGERCRSASSPLASTGCRRRPAPIPAPSSKGCSTAAARRS